MATQKLTYWPSVLSYSVKAGFSVSSLAYAGLFFGGSLKTKPVDTWDVGGTINVQWSSFLRFIYFLCL